MLCAAGACVPRHLSEEPPSDGGKVEGSDAHGPPHVALLAVNAGVAHSCALRSDGIKCWGAIAGLGDGNPRGDQPGEMGAALPLVDLGVGLTPIAFSASGDAFACALFGAGRVKCWGKAPGLGTADVRGGLPGEMGDLLPYIDFGVNRTAIAIATGTAHACVILEDGSVKCWGKNTDGQLGLGDQRDRGFLPGEMGDALPAVALGSGRHARSISCGARHTCAVLSDGSVECWGANARGELGQGDVTPRGVAPGQMGDALIPVDLGTGRTARSLAAGDDYTCATLDDNSVKCWGDNSAGNLGLGDTASRGDAAGEMGDSLARVDLGPGNAASAVVAGWSHTCALLESGRVKCWGDNAEGQLGLGDTRTRGDETGEMGEALPALDLGGAQGALFVAAGAEHTCAVLDDDTAKCWGSGVNGRLGTGDVKNRGDLPAEMGAKLAPIAL
jgi:hypothetical protein